MSLVLRHLVTFCNAEVHVDGGVNGGISCRDKGFMA
jgi:hypothetical protein